MIQPGSKLAHYEVVSPLGKGGMGEVWRAKDTKLGREVAIKTLPAEFAQDADRLARFEREAKLLASLNHANIASIFGFEDDGGTHFLVMELVEGETLADRVGRGPIPVEESLKLALQIADALKAAHEKGVIHRDLKPANIKVSDENSVKVLDFGLAKVFAGEEVEASATNSPTLSMQATRAGVILGTAAYMSPEQAKGRTVDKRADVFAFGCVLYEMLTGRQSFGKSDVTESLSAVISLEPEWAALPGGLHPRLREVVERCLAKRTTERYQDIGDVKIDIEKVLGDPAGVMVEPNAHAVAQAPQSKSLWVAAIALAAATTGLAAWMLKPETPPEPGVVGRFVHVLPNGFDFTTPTAPMVVISPDGKRIVYSANQGLFLRNLNEVEARPIQGAATGAAAPFFSPDGEWVGYWSFDGSLMKVPVTGGIPVRLADTPGVLGATWLRGDVILFAQFGGIWRVSANGGEPERIIQGTLGNPQMLPDGESVLYSDLATNEVALYSLVSGEERTLFDGEKPIYLPTGHIVYAFNGELFAVGFDIGSMEVTTGSVGLMGGVLGGLQAGQAQYALSDTGSLVYIPGRAASLDLVLAFVDRNGGRETLDVPPRLYLGPRLSPDGTRLTVEASDESGQAIFVYDLSSDSAMRRLTQGSTGNNQFPLWTADGERVTFTSDRDGSIGIYWQSADGTDVAEPLFMPDGDEAFLIPEAWSPDGQTLVFSMGLSSILDSRLWTLSVENGASSDPTPLSPEPNNGQALASFSPDGNWLAYSSTESGTLDAYVEPFPPTGRRYTVTDRNSTEAAVRAGPVWSRDGTELFYETVLPNRIVVMDVTTESGFNNGPEQELPVEEFFDLSPYRDYDVTPDGERFLVAYPADERESDESRPQIEIVVNWLEELKERVPVP